MIVHDLNADTLALTFADDDGVGTWPDDTTPDEDASPSGGLGQSAPTFKTNGLGTGNPSVRFGTGTQGLIHDNPENSSSTRYVVGKFTAPVSGIGRIAGGAVGPFSFGIWMNPDGTIGAHVNANVGGDTTDTTSGSYDDGNTHILRLVFWVIGHWYLFIDGILVADFACQPQPTLDAATERMGYASGLPEEMDIGRKVQYNKIHLSPTLSTTPANGFTAPETVLRARWGSV